VVNGYICETQNVYLSQLLDSRKHELCCVIVVGSRCSSGGQSVVYLMSPASHSDLTCSH